MLNIMIGKISFTSFIVLVSKFDNKENQFIKIKILNIMIGKITFTSFTVLVSKLDNKENQFCT
jgi:peptidoglycan biosynthesis protein MviN/MurJ (putative lipid II flippase)